MRAHPSVCLRKALTLLLCTAEVSSSPLRSCAPRRDAECSHASSSTRRCSAAFAAERSSFSAPSALFSSVTCRRSATSSFQAACKSARGQELRAAYANAKHALLHDATRHTSYKNMNVKRAQSAGNIGAVRPAARQMPLQLTKRLCSRFSAPTRQGAHLELDGYGVLGLVDRHAALTHPTCGSRSTINNSLSH